MQTMIRLSRWLAANASLFIIAIAVVSWASYARTVRAKTQSLKNMAFVETGAAFNESDLSLMPGKKDQVRCIFDPGDAFAHRDRRL